MWKTREVAPHTVTQMEDRALALGEIAWDVLQRMIRELLSRKAGGHLVESNLDSLRLSLPLPVRGSEGDPKVFSEQLVATLDALLDDAVQEAAAFRPGHAFCHRCEAAGCEHSEPPSHRHVFVGYAPTGTPRWEDFAQRCLEIRHPEVDRLYDDPPAFVTLVETGASLGGSLLEAFRRDRTCEVLGQVAAGFFPVRTRQDEGRGVIAVTFQIAASRLGKGRPRLGLNILGRTPREEPLDLLWERYDEIPWRAAVRWAQAALVSVSRQAPRRAGPQSIPRDVEARALGILRGLARRLERDQRGRSRRTHHAELRHRAGDRPTRKAVDDVRAASPGEILVDESNGTLVVPGDRGRTHFFTPEGKHVSSVRYSRDAIERKRKLGHWREAKGAEAEVLLETLRRL